MTLWHLLLTTLNLLYFTGLIYLIYGRFYQTKELRKNTTDWLLPAINSFLIVSWTSIMTTRSQWLLLVVGVSEEPLWQKEGTYLCCHDERTGTRVYSDISCHQTNILEFFIQLPVFLVTEGLKKNVGNKILFLVLLIWITWKYSCAVSCTIYITIGVHFLKSFLSLGRGGLGAVSNKFFFSLLGLSLV